MTSSCSRVGYPTSDVCSWDSSDESQVSRIARFSTARSPGLGTPRDVSDRSPPRQSHLAPEIPYTTSSDERVSMTVRSSSSASIRRLRPSTVKRVVLRRRRNRRRWVNLTAMYDASAVATMMSTLLPRYDASEATSSTHRGRCSQPHPGTGPNHRAQAVEADQLPSKGRRPCRSHLLGPVERALREVSCCPAAVAAPAPRCAQA